MASEVTPLTDPEQVERRNRWFRVAVSLHHMDDFAAMLADTEARGIRLGIYETGNWCGECDPADQHDDCCVLPTRIRTALADPEVTP